MKWINIGVGPRSQFFETPIVVDNLAGEITKDSSYVAHAQVKVGAYPIFNPNNELNCALYKRHGGRMQQTRGDPIVHCDLPNPVTSPKSLHHLQYMMADR